MEPYPEFLFQSAPFIRLPVSLPKHGDYFTGVFTMYHFPCRCDCNKTGRQLALLKGWFVKEQARKHTIVHPARHVFYTLSSVLPGMPFALSNDD